MIEHRSLERNSIPPRVAGAIHLLREKKEEAERAYRDKSRFLAVASHDLRQPIHALGLYVAELRRKISGEEEQRLVGQVARSVDAIAQLINSLLDLAKLDAGSVLPNLQSCDINAILDRINGNIRMQAEFRNIRLVIHPLPVAVISDTLMLERILTNLISNALKYTPPGGTVMVACRRRGAELSIEVRDNGIGIERERQSCIFSEYTQLNSRYPDAQNGLGLGLAIVDRLVKLLGHKIEVRSAPNKGSTFALKLKADTVISRVIQQDALTGKRMLVVEADKKEREGLAMLLASWGCEVMVARSANSVRNHLKRGLNWDLLICDEAMHDVVTKLSPQPNSMPCIVLRKDDQAENAKYHSLCKPVKPAKLRSLIQHVM